MIRLVTSQFALERMAKTVIGVTNSHSGCDLRLLSFAKRRSPPEWHFRRGYMSLGRDRGHIWSVMGVTYLRDGWHLILSVLKFSFRRFGDGLPLSNH
jgi:hypothetical protein